MRGLVRVAERFKDNPWVVGYDLMNEPWPGASWQPCLTGCPELEEALMGPFHARATAAVRAVAPGQLVFVEPFVLFNFGQAATSLPGPDPGNALSFHSYAVDPAGEVNVVARAVEAAERDASPVIATEFGATLDATVLDRIADLLDARHVPWLEWAYNESIVRDPAAPAGRDDVSGRLAALESLARPYPLAVTGTPTAVAFDPATDAYELTYATTGPDGRRYPRRLPTVVSVPSLRYPDGYTVEATGATVTSRPCADRLALRTRPHTTTTLPPHPARPTAAVTVRARRVSGTSLRAASTRRTTMRS